MPRPSEKVAEAIWQFATHYARLVRIESEKGSEGYKRLDAELPQLLKSLNDCKELRDWESVIRLVWAMQTYLEIQGHWTELTNVLEIGITAARKLERRYDESAFLGFLGTAYKNLGQVESAIKYHKQALALAREIRSRQGEGVHLGNLGNAYHHSGDMEEAIKYYEQALVIARKIGDQQSEGNNLSNLGNAYHALGLTKRNRGHVEQAIKYYEQSLFIARKIGEQRGAGIRLGHLGRAYTDLVWIMRPTEVPPEQVEQAIGYLEQSVAISGEIGDRKGESANLTSLGNALRAAGKVTLAIEKYEGALKFARESGDREGEGVCLASLGNAYHALGKMERAHDYLVQALAIFERINSPYADQARKDLNHTFDNSLNRKWPPP